MTKSEDVQYFQFDELGNMYVFQPGSGFSGNAKKIEPGDDLSATWNDIGLSCEKSFTDSGFGSDVYSQYNNNNNNNNNNIYFFQLRYSISLLFVFT